MKYGQRIATGPKQTKQRIEFIFIFHFDSFPLSEADVIFPKKREVDYSLKEFVTFYV